MRAVSLARRSDRWLRFVTLVAILVALLPLPTPVAAAPVVAAAPFTLTLSASGGVVTASPPGPVYAAGTVVTLTATPVPGNLLNGKTASLTE